MMISKLRDKYIEVNSRKKFLDDKLFELVGSVKRLEEHRDDLIKARWLINDVAESTQNLFKDRVEKLTTLAIRSVFDRPYEFKLKFEKKRNKVECRLVIEEDGEEFVPKDETGGGVLPIISFALRVVMWSLEDPKSRPVIMLDEPLKGSIGHKGDLLNKTAMMLKEVSDRLGLQLIIVTHEPTFLDIADRAYEVIREGKESVVKLIKGEEEMVAVDGDKPKIKRIIRRRK